MNSDSSGPIETAGKVATSTVDALKGNPSCLAAICLAAIFAVLTFVAFQRDADRRAKTVDILLNKCLPYIDEVQRESHPRRDESEP